MAPGRAVPHAVADETRKQLRELIAKGAAGGLFFSTDDCRASYEG
jgi:hypothetical protein